MADCIRPQTGVPAAMREAVKKGGPEGRMNNAAAPERGRRSPMNRLVYLAVLVLLTGCAPAENIGMQAVEVGKSIQLRVLGEHYL